MNTEFYWHACTVLRNIFKPFSCTILEGLVAHTPGNEFPEFVLTLTEEQRDPTLKMFKMWKASICMEISTVNSFFFSFGGQGRNILNNKNLFWKIWKHFPQYLYDILFGNCQRKQYKNIIQMLYTKSSVLEPHVIACSSEMMKNVISLYTLAVQTCLLMFFLTSK